MKRFYLDYASAAPVTPKAMQAFLKASALSGNPSSPHSFGREAKEILENARTIIAREVGVKSDAVLFTSGATESNGLAIRGHVRALLETGKNPADIHLLYLSSAHASTVEAMEALRHEGVLVEALALKDGALDLVAIRKQVRPETALVSVDMVCGETGTRFDTRGLKHAIGKALLLVDASQAPLVESVERTRLGADMITLDASKIGGVRGLGVLISPITIPLSPIVEGGGQERGIRSGTQTPALASAFATALQEAKKHRVVFGERAAKWREDFLSALSTDVPHLVNGKDQVPHIINISLPGVDTEYLAALLDASGIAVSTRSACETESAVSRAVFALSGDEARARSTLRISFGRETPNDALTTLHRMLKRDLVFLETHSVRAK